MVEDLFWIFSLIEDLPTSVYCLIVSSFVIFMHMILVAILATPKSADFFSVSTLVNFVFLLHMLPNKS